MRAPAAHGIKTTIILWESEYMGVEQAIANAAASVEMEGYHIDEQSREWCRKLLRGELSMEQYILLVKEKAGVAS